MTGSDLIVLAATLSAVGGIPVAGLALILGIDRFMSEARALTNFVGNGGATLAVARWVGDLDEAKMRMQLDRGPGYVDEDEPEAAIDANVSHMVVAK